MEKTLELIGKFLKGGSELTDKQTDICKWHELIEECPEIFDLYKLALTHSTYSHNNNNQRLAFLGDAVLKLCIREHLYITKPDGDKGLFTQVSSVIETDRNLAKIAIKLGVFDYMYIGNPSLESTNTTVNAEVLEALFGATYLLFGMEKVEELLHMYFFDYAK